MKKNIHCNLRFSAVSSQYSISYMDGSLSHYGRPTVLMVGKPDPHRRSPSRSQRGSALLSTKALVTALIAAFAMCAPDASHPISNCLNAT